MMKDYQRDEFFSVFIADDEEYIGRPGRNEFSDMEEAHRVARKLKAQEPQFSVDVTDTVTGHVYYRY